MSLGYSVDAYGSQADNLQGMEWEDVRKIAQGW